MDTTELLALLTLAAVAPYVTAAAASWIRGCDNPSTGADAPTLCRSEGIPAPCASAAILPRRHRSLRIRKAFRITSAASGLSHSLEP